MQSSGTGGKSHWDDIYARKDETEVSWFQAVPELSLQLIAETGAAADSSIIDVGGGASRLVDALLERSFSRLTVLDLSANALSKAKARLGEHAARVEWIVADVTTWIPRAQYDVWHDRAAFHFLTEADDRRRYAEILDEALAPGGHAIIATFASDGPEKCSGLPVVRYDPASLADALGPSFRLLGSRRHEHVTPWGSTQAFQFSTFVRS